jgi:hypothetical protein
MFPVSEDIDSYINFTCTSCFKTFHFLTLYLLVFLKSCRLPNEPLLNDERVVSGNLQSRKTFVSPVKIQCLRLPTPHYTEDNMWFHAACYRSVISFPTTHLPSAMSSKYKHFHSFDCSLNFPETRQPLEYKLKNISQVYDKRVKK